MTESREQDLTGARFERVSLRGATLTRVHLSVDGEWSFIQTLRHLDFVGAAWGGPDGPRQRLTLAPVGPAVGRGTPVASLTDERLATEVTRTEPGWPKAEDFPLLYAERDLTSLEKEN